MVVTRETGRDGEMLVKVSQRAQTFSYKMSKFQRSNVQHGDTVMILIIHLKVVKSIDLKYSHPKKKEKVIM